jgi:hypothetical protein
MYKAASAPDALPTKKSSNPSPLTSAIEIAVPLVDCFCGINNCNE